MLGYLFKRYKKQEAKKNDQFRDPEYSPGFLAIPFTLLSLATLGVLFSHFVLYSIFKSLALPPGTDLLHYPQGHWEGTRTFLCEKRQSLTAIKKTEMFYEHC